MKTYLDIRVKSLYILYYAHVCLFSWVTPIYIYIYIYTYIYARIYIKVYGRHWTKDLHLLSILNFTILQKSHDLGNFDNNHRVFHSH